ncbi:MAG: hypothetical protein LBO62_02975 [Endomicrobium sp.]|jgi:hypothetical protein|nr:hypothetical protein [Endomicrobium sp.]
MKKYISAIICFSIFLSFVCRDFVFAAAQTSDIGEIFFQIPQNAGFVSAENISQGNKISVINIQDLHFNPSAQQKMFAILENITKQIPIDAIYAEGVADGIDTSWIGDIDDEKLKKDVLNNLILNSRLTGYEYYSVVNGCDKKIYGLEDETVYYGNFLLLEKITDYKDETSRQLKIFNKNVSKIAMKVSNAQRLDRLIKKRDEGKISQIKYYSLLTKLYDRYCKKEERLNISRYYPANAFPNILSFILRSKELASAPQSTIKKQYAAFYYAIKNLLPYKEYETFLAQDDKTKKSLQYLAQYNLSQKYKELFSYLTCLQNLKSIDILELRNEEINLVNALRIAVSDNIFQQDINFIKDFSVYFNNFFNNNITFDEYKYFAANFKTFEDIYSYLGQEDGVPHFFTENFELFNAFISNNILRNSVFAAKVFKDIKERGYKNVVLISGGFHTEGLKEIFQSAGFNFITVTPNAVLSKDAEAIYNYNVKKQSSVFYNAFALRPSSSLPKQEKQEIILSAIESVRLIMRDSPSEYNLKLKEIAQHIPILKGLEVKTQDDDGNAIISFAYIDGELKEISFKTDENRKKTLKEKIKGLFPVFNGNNYFKDIFKAVLAFSALLLLKDLFWGVPYALFLYPLLILMFIPVIQALVLSIYILMEKDGQFYESQDYSSQIKEMPKDAKYLKQTTSIPVYNEPWSVIKRTLEYAIEARDRYNKKAGGEYANIVVSDDGLMVFANNNIDGTLSAIERKIQNGEPLTENEAQTRDRISFYKRHNIGFIARPSHKMKTSWGVFERRGLFKKASNLNHSLMINKILEELIKSGMSYEDALETVKKRRINNTPIFENTYISGNVVVGDVILLLDKDSTVPPNAILASMTEFAIDPSLGYTQNQTVINNPDETITSKLRSQEGSLLWKYVVPFDARNGFVKFLGHNGFIRKNALEKSGLWSESNVAEDFAMIMKMVTVKDEVTSKNYHGKQIQYKHITFEELVVKNMRQLRAYALENNIDLPETSFSFEEIAEKLAVFGYSKKEFTELLKTVKAQNRYPLKALNMMLNIYLESTMLFGEGMPEQPVEAIAQMSKFGYGTTELWLNPMKEWFKKGIFTPLYKNILTAKHLDFFSKMNLTMGFIMFLYPVLITALIFLTLLTPFFPFLFTFDFVPLMLFTMFAVNIPSIAEILKKNKGQGLPVIWRALFPALIEKAIFNVGVMHNSVVGTLNRLLGREKNFGATKVGKGEERKIADVAKNITTDLKIQHRASVLWFFLAASMLTLSIILSLPLATFIFIAALSSLNIIQSILVPFIFDSSVNKTPLSKKMRDNIAYYGNSAKKTIYWLSQDKNFALKTASQLLKQGFNNVAIAMDDSKKGKFLTKYSVDAIDAVFSIYAGFENGVLHFYVNSSNGDLSKRQKDEALKEALKKIKLLLCGSHFLSPDKESLDAVKKIYSSNKPLGDIKFKDISFDDSMVLQDSQDGVYKAERYLNALAADKNKRVIAKFKMNGVKQIKRLLKNSFYDEVFLSVESDKINASDIKKLSNLFRDKYISLNIGVDFKQSSEVFIKDLAKNKSVKNLIIRYGDLDKEQILKSLESIAAEKQTDASISIDQSLLQDKIFIATIRNLGFSLVLSDFTYKEYSQNDFFDMDFTNVSYEDFREFINSVSQTNVSNILFDAQSFAQMARKANLAQQINLTRVDFEEIFDRNVFTNVSAASDELPPAFADNGKQTPNVDELLNISNTDRINAILQAA